MITLWIQTRVHLFHYVFQVLKQIDFPRTNIDIRLIVMVHYMGALHNFLFTKVECLEPGERFREFLAIW